MTQHRDLHIRHRSQPKHTEHPPRGEEDKRANEHPGILPDQHHPKSKAGSSGCTLHAAPQQAAAVFAGCGAAYLQARALAVLGRALADRGDLAGADAAWTRVEDLYTRADVPDEDRIHRRPDAWP
jgi:hypothetical protein